MLSLNMSDSLPPSLLKTMAFFDLFDMPLRPEEVGRFLYRPGEKRRTEEEIESVLQQLTLAGQVQSVHGRYFLADRKSDLVRQREAAEVRSSGMLEDAKSWLSFLAGWPGVEMVAVCNTLGWMNASTESDIDLFLIVEPGKIWQTRFALASLLHVFRKRPLPGNEYGKLCLSFLATSDALDFSALPIENDIYLAYWFCSLLPVHDPSGHLPALLRQNQAFLENTIGYREPLHEARPERISESARQWGFRMGRLASILTKRERWLKEFQIKRFPPAIRNAARQGGSDVIVSDTMLKFHVNDRRRQYRDLWLKRCEGLHVS